MFNQYSLTIKNEEDIRVDKQFFSETKLGNKVFSANDFYIPYIQYSAKEISDLERAISTEEDDEYGSMSIADLFDINNKFNQEMIEIIKETWSQEDIDDIVRSLQQNEKVTDKENLMKAKRLKKLSESIKNESMKDKLTDKSELIDEVLENDESMKQMEDILENTSIGKIAKEVTEELNIESMLSEGGGIEDIMKGDNMMNIFQSISSKIDGANGGGNNIMEEAMGITKNMKDNPLFSSMFSSLSKMDPSTTQAVAEAKENVDNRRIRLTNPHDGSETKKRLQKKLKQKEEKLEVNKKQ